MAELLAAAFFQQGLIKMYNCTFSRRTTLYVRTLNKFSFLLLLPWNEDLLLEERSKEPPLFHVTAGSTPESRNNYK